MRANFHLSSSLLVILALLCIMTTLSTVPVYAGDIPKDSSSTSSTPSATPKSSSSSSSTSSTSSTSGGNDGGNDGGSTSGGGTSGGSGGTSGGSGGTSGSNNGGTPNSGGLIGNSTSGSSLLTGDIKSIPNSRNEFSNIDLDTDCGRAIADSLLRARTACSPSVAVCATCANFLNNVHPGIKQGLINAGCDQTQSYAELQARMADIKTWFDSIPCNSVTAPVPSVSPGNNFATVSWEIERSTNEFLPYSFTVEFQKLGSSERQSFNVQPLLTQIVPKLKYTAVIRYSFTHGAIYNFFLRVSRGVATSVTTNSVPVTFPTLEALSLGTPVLSLVDLYGLDLSSTKVYTSSATRFTMSAAVLGNTGVNPCSTTTNTDATSTSGSGTSADGGTSGGSGANGGTTTTTTTSTCVPPISFKWSVSNTDAGEAFSYSSNGTGVVGNLFSGATVIIDAGTLPLNRTLKLTVTATWKDANARTWTISKELYVVTFGRPSALNCGVNNSTGVYMKDIFALQCGNEGSFTRQFFYRVINDRTTTDIAIFPRVSSTPGRFFIDTLPIGANNVYVVSSSPITGTFYQVLVLTLIAPALTDPNVRSSMLDQAKNIYNADPTRSGISTSVNLMNTLSSDKGSAPANEDTQRKDARSNMVTTCVSIFAGMTSDSAAADPTRSNFTSVDLANACILFNDLVKFPNELSIPALQDALKALRNIAKLLISLGLEETAKAATVEAIGSLLKALSINKNAMGSSLAIELSSVSFDVLTRLGAAARINQAVGEVDTIQTNDLTVVNQKRDRTTLGNTDISSTADSNSASFKLPNAAAGDNNIIGVEYLHHKENPFSWETGFASDVYTLRLTTETGTEIPVSNLSTSDPIIIRIPLTRALSGNNTHFTCKFWDEVAANFSTEGCTVDKNATTTSVLVCRCTHLTSFTVFEVNNIDFDDVAANLGSRINERPWLIVFIGAILLVYVIILPIAYKKDKADDGEVDRAAALSKGNEYGDPESLTTSDTVAEILSVANKEEQAARDAKPIPFKERLIANLRNRHLYLSVFVKRHLDRDFSRVERATVCLTTLLVCQAINTLTYQSFSFSGLQVGMAIVNGIIATLIVFPFITLAVELFRHSRRFSPSVAKTIYAMEKGIEMTGYGYDQPNPVGQKTLLQRWNAWRIPHYWKYITYTYCFLLCAGAIFVTVFWSYSDVFADGDTYRMWLISAAASICQSIIISSTFKIFFMTVLLTLVDKCRARRHHRLK